MGVRVVGNSPAGFGWDGDRAAATRSGEEGQARSSGKESGVGVGIDEEGGELRARAERRAERGVIVRAPGGIGATQGRVAAADGCVGSPEDHGAPERGEADEQKRDPAGEYVGQGV